VRNSLTRTRGTASFSVNEITKRGSYPFFARRPAGIRKNATRQSASIPGKLLREGALHLLPVYYLLTLSDLAREGIANSGSFRFADHIYAGLASGRTPLGRFLDRRLLAMPAACAFRRRYQRAQSAIRHALESAPADVFPLRVLAVPCGIPRDMTELAATLHREDPALVARIEYHAMDIDPSVLRLAQSVIGDSPLAGAYFHCGDALSATDYPPVAFHAVVSTGLGDFLDDAELGMLFANVYRALEPGGTFYTSASARDPRSDVLLRMVELLPHYRTADQLATILRGFKWRALGLEVDETGLQTFVVAVK
jgi:SAM-dependent methyltransferase